MALLSSITRRYHFEAAFRGHRNQAKRRGIEFQLSFAQWLRIWEKSGHLVERGCKRGQYVMARKGDRGPYAVGNIKIILHTENSREWERTPAYRERKRLESTGRRHTQKARAKMSANRRGKYQGGNKKLTPEQVRAIRAAYPGETQTALARQYGVRQGTIWGIVSGIRWREVV